MYEKINFGGWPNCIRLYNEESELVVTTDIGPRMVRFGYINQQNFFYLSAEDAGKTGGDKWRIYGGHRLWIAPESIPGSYYPDNSPVTFTCDNNTVKLSQSKETTSGIVKEMDITLSPDKNEVTVIHRFINRGNEAKELSLWAISALAANGRAIVPQEPFGEGDDFLLPTRPLALWQYTKMNDPRWIWGEKYIQAKQIPSITSEQKIGVLNKQQWMAYYLNGQLLIKKIPFKQVAVYPDFSSNCEVYINGNLLEIETLGPLQTLAPGGVLEHVEHWLLVKADMDESEHDIDEKLLSIINNIAPGASS